jgi:hypothetical protein
MEQLLASSAHHQRRRVYSIHHLLVALAGLFLTHREVSLPTLLGTRCHKDRELRLLAATPWWSSYSSCVDVGLEVFCTALLGGHFQLQSQCSWGAATTLGVVTTVAFHTRLMGAPL